MIPKFIQIATGMSRDCWGLFALDENGAVYVYIDNEDGWRRLAGDEKRDMAERLQP